MLRGQQENMFLQEKAHWKTVKNSFTSYPCIVPFLAISIIIREKKLLVYLFIYWFRYARFHIPENDKSP